MSIKEYKKITEQINKFYKNLEWEINKYKKVYAINCIGLCGKCCTNEKIEATVLEFFPLVFELLKKKRINFFLKKIENQPGMCIFYEHQKDDPEKGFCSVYKKRGLICRLFGFSCTLNKYNEPIFAACDILKNKDLILVQRIQRDIDKGLKIPVFSKYYLKFSSIDPNLSLKTYPINIAIKNAIEKILLVEKYY